MNDQHIEQIITNLYDMIQDARPLPLMGADKCIIEREKALDMLDDIIAQLPAELKQSRTIVESRNTLIGQARHEAEAIINKAAEEAAAMVSQEAIYNEAKIQCAEMVEKTKAQIAALRKASNEYMDDALRRTQEAIAQSLAEVEDTRAKFQALTAKAEEA
jgi:hypothetical protein